MEEEVITGFSQRSMDHLITDKSCMLTHKHNIFFFVLRVNMSEYGHDVRMYGFVLL